MPTSAKTFPNEAEAARAVDELQAKLAPLALDLDRVLGPARSAVFRAMLESAKNPGSNTLFSLPMYNWDTGLEESATPPEDNATYRFELELIETLGGNFQACLNLLPDMDMSKPEAEDLPQIGFGFEVNRGLPVGMVYEDPLGGDVSLMVHGLPAEKSGQGSQLLINVLDPDIRVRRNSDLLPSLTDPHGQAPKPNSSPQNSA